jgi:hypothetical protein
MRVPLVVAIFCCLSTSARAQTGIERAAWLAGCWELRTATRVTLEMWMPAAGNTMLGASRTVVGGATREFEFLRLSVRGDTLVYTAIPSGQRETDFKAVGSGTSPLTFENPAHDFPQRVIYRRPSADSLVARIEGPGPNNTTRGIDFPMRRVNCSSQ